MVSHNMEDVASVADRVAVLVDGEIVLSGNPCEVFSDQERLRNIHLDVPEITSFMNMLSESTGEFHDTYLCVDEAKNAILSLLQPKVKPEPSIELEVVEP